MPDIAIDVREDIFRIRELEMDWDIGAVIYQPQDAKRIPSGADGKKAGVFLLHGGVSDFKSVERIARTLPSKFGIKVAFDDFSRTILFSRSRSGLAWRRRKRRWHGAHAALDQRNAHHAGPVHDRPGHFEARRLRHR